MPPMPITVVSDVVCPWCYVGKANLQAALADVPAIDYVLIWRPHQLDASIPPEGISRKDYLAARFPDSGRLFAVQQTLMESAEAVGVSFNFDKIKKSPNTLNAHRVIHWARGQGLASELVERLMRGYFVEGEDIGDIDTLAALAADIGMEKDLVSQLLRSNADIEAVRSDIETFRRLGVTAVPCFIFGNGVAVMGAHPPKQLRKAFDQVQAALAS